MDSFAPSTPHNQEAEAALLGSILIDPEAFFEVSDLVEAQDFYIHRHGWIWEAIQTLHDRRSPVDLLTICDELERTGRLAETGGAAFLAGLVNQVPTSLHAAEYARLVAEAAIRRKMLKAANEIGKLAYQEELPVEQAVQQAENEVLALSSGKQKADLVSAQTVIHQVYEQMNGPDTQSAIPTGFTDLDRLMAGGQRPSELIVVAGRPGMGKTGFLLSIIGHAVGFEKRIALFSLEMDATGMMMRLLSQASSIPQEKLRTRRLGADDWNAINQASETFCASQLYIDDTPALTPNQLRTRCRRLQAQGGLDLVVVDYLQLMSGGGRFENRTQEVGHISRSLKLIARELRVPVLAAAQLSRNVDQRNDKRPVLADLRESGAIEQDADIVMFLYRPEMYDDTAEKGIAKLLVAKQRNGPTGEIDLAYRSSLTRFENRKQDNQS